MAGLKWSLSVLSARGRPFSVGGVSPAPPGSELSVESSCSDDEEFTRLQGVKGVIIPRCNEVK